MKRIMLLSMLLLSMFVIMVPRVSAHEIQFNPIADSWVWDIYPNNNYGSDTYLHARSDTAQIRRTYLKFDLRTLNPDLICGAVLKMHVSAAEPLGYIDVDLCELNDDTWTEMGITWNNAPAPGPVILTAHVDGTCTWVYGWGEPSADPSQLLKAYVKAQISQDGIVSMVVKIPNDLTQTNAPIYHRDFESRERTTNKPYLDIVYDQGPCVPEFGLSSMIVSSIAFSVLMISRRVLWKRT